MSPTFSLKSKISNLPQKPGVYLFKDKTGKVIYIGKAKNLRSRVKQYFQQRDKRPQIPYLLKNIADVDITLTHNELESLYLENSLIKKYLPKYNIELRDDKNYAFIKIDNSTQIPQITIVRKIDDKKIGNSQYFGPYSAAYKIKNTLNLVRKIFPFCAATKISDRPCFYFHLHRCPGVCVGKITLAEYQKQLKKIAWFLAGNTAKAKAEIKKEMLAVSKAKKFEAAARLRDQLKVLQLLEEKQTAILSKKVDWDVIAATCSSSPSPMAEENGLPAEALPTHSNFDEGGAKAGSETENLACVNLFKVRGGKLLDKENFIWVAKSDKRNLTGRSNCVAETLQIFLEKYYLETSEIPKAIFLPAKIENEVLIQKLIADRFKKQIKILMPQRGKAKQLLQLGQANAEEHLKNYLADKTLTLDKIQTALARLKEILNLPRAPKRVEGYDISNLQGTNPVGSMVVFLDGLPAKSQYRKFKIQSKTTPDDFTMMREILSRRFAKMQTDGQAEILNSKSETNSKLQNLKFQTAWPEPNLIVIDGGKGQLNAALLALKNSKLKTQNSKLIPIIGLAKRLEEIFVPGKKKSIILRHSDPALQLLQRLRDEAHRFGITFHRSLRARQAVKSALDEIPGLGPKTKKLLKTKFGTISEIKNASPEELKTLVGQKLTKTIKEFL